MRIKAFSKAYFDLINELPDLQAIFVIGDRLTVRGTVVEVTPSRSKPEIGSIRTETSVTNQQGILVMRFTSIVLMRKRPGA